MYFTPQDDSQLVDKEKKKIQAETCIRYNINLREQVTKVFIILKLSGTAFFATAHSIFINVRFK